MSAIDGEVSFSASERRSPAVDAGSPIPEP
jgi:hypothetical protein